MRLAVLIPVHDAESGLATTLASLAAEPCDFDIVVVDDGSPRPLALPGRVDGRHVVSLRHAENLGVAAALNTGLRHILARGYEYVARIDAGDIDRPDRLVRQMAHLDRRPEVALVGAATRHVDPRGRVLYVTRYPGTWPEVQRRFYYRTAFSHPACMLRTSALRASGLYDEQFTLAEDYDLFWRLARRFPCENLPDALVTRIETERSLMVRRRRAASLARLAVQWRQFHWDNVDCWLGLARSFALTLVPARALTAIKTARGAAG